jgi:hypothetical protein
LKSNAILNTTIAVTSAAIITVLVGLVYSLFFRTQLNSPIYYGIVIVMAAASILLAAFQIWPSFRFFAPRKLHTLDEGLIYPSLADTETEQAFLDEVMHQAVIEEMLQVISTLPPKQRRALIDKLGLTLDGQTIIDRKSIDTSIEKDLPVKVTMEVKGTPITIESPDVRKVEEIMQQVTRDIQASSTDTSDKEGGSSVLPLSEGVRKIRIPSNPTAGQFQPGLLREDQETYQADDPAAQP